MKKFVDYIRGKAIFKTMINFIESSWICYHCHLPLNCIDGCRIWLFHLIHQHLQYLTHVTCVVSIFLFGRHIVSKNSSRTISSNLPGKVSYHHKMSVHGIGSAIQFEMYYHCPYKFRYLVFFKELLINVSVSTHLLYYNRPLGPLSLTRINFNLSIDK